MLSDRFRAAAESKDFLQLEEIFTEDVTFRSPAVFKPYEGRDAIGMILHTVSQVFEDFQYVHELEGADATCLLFRARVGDREIEGIDYRRLGPDGRVTELTVMVRPYSAATALRDAMAAKLEAASA